MRLSFLSLVLLLVACGPESGIPQPDPIPYSSMIRTTGALPTPSPDRVDVIGLPTAVAGMGMVHLKSQTEEVTSEATADGSFAAGIKAAAGEQLEVRYRSSEPAQVLVHPMPITMLNPGPNALFSDPPITPPDASGLVTVRGGAAANADLVIVNFSSGGVASGQASIDGTFVLQIQASSGDEVRVYALGEPLSAPWTQTVP